MHEYKDTSSNAEGEAEKKKSKEDRSGLTIQCIPALPLLLMQKLESSLPIYMSLMELCMFE